MIYSNLVAPLVEAVKTLYGRIVSVEDDVLELKAENQQIKAENYALSVRMGSVVQENLQIKSENRKIQNENEEVNLRLKFIGQRMDLTSEK